MIPNDFRRRSYTIDYAQRESYETPKTPRGSVEPTEAPSGGRQRANTLVRVEGARRKLGEMALLEGVSEALKDRYPTAEAYLEGHVHLDKPFIASNAIVTCFTTYPDDAKTICNALIQRFEKDKEGAQVLLAALLDVLNRRTQKDVLLHQKVAKLVFDFLQKVQDPRGFVKALFTAYFQKNHASHDGASAVILACTKCDLEDQTLSTCFRQSDISTVLTAQFVRSELEKDGELSALAKKIQRLKNKDFKSLAHKIISYIHDVRLNPSCKKLLGKRRKLVEAFIAEKDKSKDAKTLSRSLGEVLFLRVINPFLTTELRSNSTIVKISRLLQALSNQVPLEEGKPDAALLNDLYHAHIKKHCAFIDSITK